MLRAIAIAAVFVTIAAPARGEFVEWSRIGTDLDITDLNNVRNNFGGTGLGDYTLDGLVNIDDLNYVRNGYDVFPWEIPSRITPGDPTTSDEIRFFLNYGGGFNACDAYQRYGEPFLTVDPELRSVLVNFVLPSEPVFCPDVDDPVGGLEGAFGPLAAGDWTLGIAGQPPFVEFNVIEAAAVPEPSTGLLAIAASGMFLAMRGRGTATRLFRL